MHCKLQEMENFVKVCGCQIMEKSAGDVELFHKHVAPGHKVTHLVSRSLAENSCGSLIYRVRQQNNWDHL